MKINDIVVEKTKDPRSEVKRREQFRTGGGTHKDRKKAAKRGEAKHKKQAVPMGEGVAKIACTKCDEVSTAAAWKKNNNFCPKCKTSSQGVAEGDEFRVELDLDEKLYEYEDRSYIKPFKHKQTGQKLFQVSNKEGTLRIIDNEREAKKFSRSGDARRAAQDRRIFGDEGVSEGKEELHSQLMDINRKLKMMRRGPEPGETNSVAFVDKRLKLQKQKEEILAKLKRTDEDGVAEAGPDTTIAGLRGYKTWQVWIKNNYYNGKYADYSARPYTVIASSADEAKQVVLDNADYILKSLMSKKLPNGRRVLPPRSALPITDQEIGRIEDGTVKGKATTMGDKLSTYLSPQGPMKVKLDGGKIVDVEQGVAEAGRGFRGRSSWDPNMWSRTAK